MAATMTIMSICLFTACTLIMANDAAGFNCVGIYKPDQVVKLQRNCTEAIMCHRKGYMYTETVKSCPLTTRCVDNSCVCEEGMVVATLDYSGLVEMCKYPMQCLYKDRIYNDNNYWLRSDCLQKYKCVEGNVEDLGSYTCPPDSACYEGHCKCFGDKIESVGEDNFIVTNCTEPETIETPDLPGVEVTTATLNQSSSNLECKDAVNTYVLHREWLQNDCKRKYKCAVDGIKAGVTHGCPEHSSCNNSNYYGVCKCDAGYLEMGRDDTGFLLGCRRECRDAVNTYDLHREWLQNDCKRKYKCAVDGIKAGVTHGCPKHSSCNNSNYYGVCKCDAGYLEMGRDDTGFLLGCRRECRDAVNTYDLHREWLQNDCKRKYKCAVDGIKAGVTHGCPEHSSCDNSNYYGVCKCDAGYLEMGRDDTGFLLGCRRECRDAVNTYDLHREWLQNDCKRKYKCAVDGIKAGVTHGCPEHSSCDNSNYYGVCKCDAGYLEMGRDDTGFLLGCRRECRDAVNTYDLHREWLQNDCKRKYKCAVDGIKAGVTHGCPEHSSCDNSNYYGVCKCDAGYLEMGRDDTGFLLGCRRECRDAVNTYDLHREWLQNDCKRKYKCAVDGIKAGVTHGCPEHSSCNNSNYYGVCECDAGYSEIVRDEKGFLFGCSRDCRDAVNAYKFNAEWLQTDCKRKYKCSIGGVIKAGVSHGCPEHSSCDNTNYYGVCKCDVEYTETGRDESGFLLGCQRNN